MIQSHDPIYNAKKLIGISPDETLPADLDRFIRKIQLNYVALGGTSNEMSRQLTALAVAIWQHDEKNQ